MIAIGKRLAEAGLVCASSGNLSARLDSSNILITATATKLGDLEYSDILKVSLDKSVPYGAKRLPSSELPMHRSIYQNFGCRVVIHCHPPLANGYFAVASELKILTFEARYYLNKIPVIKQTGLNVTDPDKVIQALKKNSLVVVKNHGVFSVGDGFQQALDPVLILEEAVKVAAIARLFKKNALDKIDRGIKKCLLSRK
jgi:L-fuculose-phosphate aldolase